MHLSWNIFKCWKKQQQLTSAGLHCCPVRLQSAVNTERVSYGRGHTALSRPVRAAIQQHCCPHDDELSHKWTCGSYRKKGQAWLDDEGGKKKKLHIIKKKTGWTLTPSAAQLRLQVFGHCWFLWNKRTWKNTCTESVRVLFETEKQSTAEQKPDSHRLGLMLYEKTDRFTFLPVCYDSSLAKHDRKETKQKKKRKKKGHASMYSEVSVSITWQLTDREQKPDSLRRESSLNTMSRCRLDYGFLTDKVLHPVR